jgi:hypothetical protein
MPKTSGRRFIHRRNLRGTAWAVLFLVTLGLSGCVKSSIDKAIRALDDAVTRLEGQSISWQGVLEETRDRLIEEGQSTIANEVSNVLSQTVSDVGIEARCYTDFLRDRVREDLIRIRATLTGETLTLRPVFCNPTPSIVDLNLPADRRTHIEISGYNLDVANIQAQLVDSANQPMDVSNALASPSRYLLTLNLGSNGVPLDASSDKLLFVLPDGTKSVNIIQPAEATAVPQPVAYTVTLVTGCIDGGGTDANVYIVLTGPRGSTPETELDIANHDDRERCTTDSYQLVSDDLGDLTQVSIRHDNTDGRPGWFLEEVTVRNSLSGQDWEFLCGRWLATSEDDGHIFRTIFPGGPCS